MIETLNNSEEYVNKIIKLFFYDYEIEEDQMEILTDEIQTIEHVANLFKEKKFIDEDKFQDFNFMYQYMFNAFLINDEEYDPNGLYLISTLVDLKEFDFALWLITSGPLCSKEFICDERAMLFRWIASDAELLSTFNVNKLNSLLCMTDKFDFEHLYQDEHFNMHFEDGLLAHSDDELVEPFLKKKKMINGIDYLLLTIYSHNFIQKKITNITPENLETINSQRQLLLNKKQRIIELRELRNQQASQEEELENEQSENESLSGDTEPYNSSASES